MNKVIDINQAINAMGDGITLMSGGFGLCGNPENLIQAIFNKGIKDLTIISNNCGTTEYGLGLLLKEGRIKKMISSYVGENKIFESLYLNGKLEVELVPQGSLAEKIRAGGAGIPAFYTKTGVHTMVADGGLPMLYDHEGNVKKTSVKKETREFNGEEYVLEHALTADFAIIKAQVADTFGNLIFNKTARNFNPIMATAAKVTIVEVEEIVELGDLDPDRVHLAGAYINHIVKGKTVNKVIDINQAINAMGDGITLMSGGFGLCGNPENLIQAIFNKGIKDLTIISNNCGTTEYGLGLLLKEGRIKKMISSYVGENKIFESLYLNGKLEVELVPQGSLAEKIRAGGAGIPAFYTKTGVHTMVADGGLPMLYDHEGNVKKTSVKKETREFNGEEYVLEHALTADFAIIKAQVADTFGNLIFNKTARNFNPIMATAAKVTIVEVEEIVELGDLDPDRVHLAGAYINHIVIGSSYQKWIEQRTVQTKGA